VHIGDKYTIDYYKDIVEQHILEDRQNIVYMVDLSIQPYTDLQVFKNWLDELGIDFYWIDHHMSAIEATKHLNIPGIQNTKHSGCWLAWNYLNENMDIPVLINKVSDFDIWNLHSEYDWQNELLPLTYYLESFGFDINDNNSYLVKLLNNRN